MATELIPLNKTELSNLRECEEVIELGQKTFVEVGNALAKIKEGKLYKAHYESFGDYCQGKWGFKSNYAQRLISASEVVENVKLNISPPTGKSVPIGTKQKGGAGPLPITESQARSLGQLPTPEKQAAAWQDAVDLAKERSAPITAAVVEEVVQLHISQQEPSGNGQRDETPWDQTEDESPPEPEHVFDALGNVVHESLIDVFKNRESFDESMKAVSALKKKVHALMETPAGGWIEGQEFDRLLTDVRSLLKFAQPHTECAKCRRDPKDSCPACKGTGWVHVAMFNSSFSDEDKAWLTTL